MAHTYEFQIHTTRNQTIFVNECIGCCRYVSNFYVNRYLQKKHKGKDGANLVNAYRQHLDTLIASHPWLKATDKNALVHSLDDLERTIKRNSKSKQQTYPQIQTVLDAYPSYCITKGIRVIDGNHIQLGKLGTITHHNKKKLVGRPLSATIKKIPSGKIWVTLRCTDTKESYGNQKRNHGKERKGRVA